MNQHAPPPPPTMVANPDGSLRPLRFDPDGASIGPEVPDELLLRWQNMLARCGAAQARMHKNYERFFKEQEACIIAMRSLLEDASGIADDLRDLSALFEEAMNWANVDGKLGEALRLVHNSMITMADRLEALEIQGDAAFERYHL